MNQETITRMHQFERKDWQQMEEQLNDTIHHIKSRVNIYTRLYLERLCKDQLQYGNVSFKFFILAYDNFIHIIINNGALAK